MKTLMTACGLVAMLAAAPAFAQSATPTNKTTAPSVASTEGAVDPAIARMSADQLKNKEVYGTDGKEIAKVEGVVRKGNDTYAVLDVDHLVNISDKDAVLPMNKLHMKGDKLTVDMTKDQMQGLEKWQKGKYEDIKGALK
ncbi:PRC-barrel domain-containing protein [Azospirillum canadense]|uniref:PRC-barrel domain-containing protein n=1 Tax=Azospirillum canadense TaxID=403962 RepID=UPI0022260AF0|nr:PRC-barrel domain-containing protein [Azospirillum canadense]MCW2238435.1 sporulation protein YlmC with PRC-barrel domain [Azospirillum canadense]